jgi:hypothetical protein
MATVTGMTAAAMQAIRDGMVVSAGFDSANHLILTKYDGTQVDAGIVGAATTTLAGPVELATSAETQTGTDAVRAVTPAGLASIPGKKVEDLGSNSKTEAQIYADYPEGISTLYLTDGSGWSLNSGYGTVLTINLDSDRCEQTFYARAGGASGIPRAWMRFHHSSDGGGGWTPWREVSFMSTLTAASYTQATALNSYPAGWSRLYYTTATGGSWDFTGMAGEVLTWYDSATAFARQTFTQHSAGSSNTPEVWFRTADGTSSWSSWRKQNSTPGAWPIYTPTWTTDSGLHIPTFGNAVVACKWTKTNRMATVKFSVTFGSSTNFNSGGSTDNWVFGLPVAAANSTDDTIGFLEMYQSGTANGLARAKLYSTTGFKLNIIAGSTANINSDVDASQPFTWASGNTLRGLLTYETAS